MRQSLDRGNDILPDSSGSEQSRLTSAPRHASISNRLKGKPMLRPLPAVSSFCDRRPGTDRRVRQAHRRRSAKSPAALHLLRRPDCAGDWDRFTRTGPTYLMPASADPKHPSCPRSGGRKIDHIGRDFVGRKGDFLVFVPSDANGLEMLEVRSLKDGVRLYDNMMVPGAFKSALVSGDQLRLAYTRGYAASCSLLENSTGCWAKMMKGGKFSRAIAQQPPPVKACQVGYANSPSKDPPGDTSVLTYDVDVTIEPGKKGVVNSRSALGLLPSS